ncbi:hypothetical protein HY988_06600 [Candidatus Micrarchaeota archaeon]|nr:hypothetical protein [Candidatus Micrarchaeota archaeon]
MSNMVTIQELVNEELRKSPILVDMLQQELVNVNAVATKLHTKIEKKRGKKVELPAIGMAIRRFMEEYLGKAIFQWNFPKDLEVSTKSKIYEVAIEKTPDIPKILDHLYKHIKRQKGEVLSVIEGTYEIAIFTNQTNKKYVLEAIKGQIITSELDNLAYVTVNWAKITKDIPGVYYRITRELALKNISIQAMHTIGAEMMLLFKEEVLVDAYSTIGNLLAQEK